MPSTTSCLKNFFRSEYARVCSNDSKLECSKCSWVKQIDKNNKHLLGRVKKNFQKHMTLCKGVKADMENPSKKHKGFPLDFIEVGEVLHNVVINNTFDNNMSSQFVRITDPTSLGGGVGADGTIRI